MVETLLLSTTPVTTFGAEGRLSSATGFFFERQGRRFVVTSRHVLLDEASGHRPHRIEVEVHTDATDLTRTSVLSLLLYERGTPVWSEATDSAGPVDVAVIPLQPSVWPSQAVARCFQDIHLPASLDAVQVGANLLVPGYPLGFHDTVHRLPVVRSACVASAFGVRFQGQGYFLTDSRTHRGTSGAPVVLAHPTGRGDLPWQLLGVHSSRMDLRDRDRVQDESLGLNCAWYADVLVPLTAASPKS
jgi:hypothetical protein